MGKPDCKNCKVYLARLEFKFEDYPFYDDACQYCLAREEANGDSESFETDTT